MPPNVDSWLLHGLNFMSHFRPYCSQILTSLWSPWQEGDIKTMSSAYNMHPINNLPMWEPEPEYQRSEIRSLTYTEKRYGESTPPCRTPHAIGNHSPMNPFHLTAQCNWLYQLISSNTKHNGAFLSSNFLYKPLCDTLSNACLRRPWCAIKAINSWVVHERLSICTCASLMSPFSTFYLYIS